MSNTNNELADFKVLDSWDPPPKSRKITIRLNYQKMVVANKDQLERQAQLEQNNKSKRTNILFDLKVTKTRKITKVNAPSAEVDDSGQSSPDLNQIIHIRKNNLNQSLQDVDENEFEPATPPRNQQFRNYQGIEEPADLRQVLEENQSESDPETPPRNQFQTHANDNDREASLDLRQLLDENQNESDPETPPRNQQLRNKLQTHANYKDREGSSDLRQVLDERRARFSRLILHENDYGRATRPFREYQNAQSSRSLIAKRDSSDSETTVIISPRKRRKMRERIRAHKLVKRRYRNYEKYPGTSSSDSEYGRDFQLLRMPTFRRNRYREWLLRSRSNSETSLGSLEESEPSYARQRSLSFDDVSSTSGCEAEEVSKKFNKHSHYSNFDLKTRQNFMKPKNNSRSQSRSKDRSPAHYHDAEKLPNPKSKFRPQRSLSPVETSTREETLPTPHRRQKSISLDVHFGANDQNQLFASHSANGQPQPGNINFLPHGSNSFPQPGNGHYPQPGCSNFPQPGNGNFPQHGNSNFSQPGNGNFPQHGNSNFSQPGNSNFTQHGNSNFTQHGNSNFPQHGNSNFPQTGNSNFSPHGNSNFPHSQPNRQNQMFMPHPGQPEFNNFSFPQSQYMNQNSAFTPRPEMNMPTQQPPSGNVYPHSDYQNQFMPQPGMNMQAGQPQHMNVPFNHSQQPTYPNQMFSPHPEINQQQQPNFHNHITPRLDMGNNNSPHMGPSYENSHPFMGENSIPGGMQYENNYIQPPFNNFNNSNFTGPPNQSSNTGNIFPIVNGEKNKKQDRTSNRLVLTVPIQNIEEKEKQMPVAVTSIKLEEEEEEEEEEEDTEPSIEIKEEVISPYNDNIFRNPYSSEQFTSSQHIKSSPKHEVSSFSAPQDYHMFVEDYYDQPPNSPALESKQPAPTEQLERELLTLKEFMNKGAPGTPPPPPVVHIKMEKLETNSNFGKWNTKSAKQPIQIQLNCFQKKTDELDCPPPPTLSIGGEEAPPPPPPPPIISQSKGRRRRKR